MINAADILGKLFGTKTVQLGNYSGPSEYNEPGLIQNAMDKVKNFGQSFRPKEEMIGIDTKGYNVQPEQSPYEQPVMGMQEQYQEPPQEQPQQEVGKYEFPAGDKPAVPPIYHAQLDGIENANIVASVLAQETGGYGYQVPDPETGEFVGWDTAKAKNIRGASGEVGISQIIPKWHFKEAGFVDEETYAQALYDPTFAIDEAGRILNNAFRIYGDWEKALGTWNKGPNYPKEVLGRIGIQL